MFHTLTNVQQGGATALQQYIDNRCGQLRVGLRSLVYTVGWWNVGAGESFSWRVDGGLATMVQVTPGLYGFSMLQASIEAAPAATLSVDPTNGIAALVVATGYEILLSDGILALLGLTGQWLHAGTYRGDRPVDFTGALAALNIHLDQINSTFNIVNGASSNLLASIGGPACYYKFGDIRTVWIEHPEFKRLQEGAVSELKLTVRDGNGGIVDNHNLEIAAVLEIR